MLARVHGQRGWAIMTMVERPGVWRIVLSEGHALGGAASTPGVLE
jgi:hypothetical protein